MTLRQKFNVDYILKQSQIVAKIFWKNIFPLCLPTKQISTPSISLFINTNRITTLVLVK